MKIKPFTSFFLDSLRVVAALCVFISHIPLTRIANMKETSIGHLSVICFFVLSGLVISATTDPQKTPAARYFSLRIARLWTVALPCLAITLLLEILGRHFASEHYAQFSRGSMLFRYALTSVFLNESASWSAGPPTNSPVWSLPYEAWYYILFGVWIYVIPFSRRLVIFSICALIAGPPILLLMPIWILGVVACRLCRDDKTVHLWRWPIFVFSIVLATVYLRFQPKWPTESGSKPWFFSGSWISDLIFGCAVAGIIVAIDLIWGYAKAPVRLSAFVREMANVSFTFYLLHFPIMVFLSGTLRYDHNNILQVSSVLFFVFLIIYVIG